MLRLGVVLVFFGLGSALLHVMGWQFTLLKWSGPMQPVLGLSIGGLGAAIVLIKMLTSKDEPAEQGQAGAPQQFGPPPSGPPQFGPPPVGAQSSGPYPQQYGPGPQSFGPPSGPQPVQQQFGPPQGFAPQGQPPFREPPYGSQGGQQFGPRG